MMENKSKKKAKCDGLICPTCKSANTKKHYSGNKCKECKTVFWTKDEGETANSVKPVVGSASDELNKEQEMDYWQHLKNQCGGKSFDGDVVWTKWACSWIYENLELMLRRYVKGKV